MTMIHMFIYMNKQTKINIFFQNQLKTKTQVQGTKQTMAKGKSPVKITLESSSYAIGHNQLNKKAHNSELARRAANLPGKKRQQGPG